MPMSTSSSASVSRNSLYSISSMALTLHLRAPSSPPTFLRPLVTLPSSRSTVSVSRRCMFACSLFASLLPTRVAAVARLVVVAEVARGWG